MLDDIHVNAPDRTTLKNSVESFRRELEAAFTLRDGCGDPNDTLFAEINSVEGWYRSADWANRNAALHSLLQCPSINRNRKGRKENWSAEKLDQARAFFVEQFNTTLASIQSMLYSSACAELLSWIKGAVTAYTEAKSVRGLLDFHDLLLFARDMLLNRREARDFFKTRFNYILVDEFQDTDPLQAEIVFFLGEKADRFEREWESVELEPGRLFIVGDPKQSVYRFRRADLDLYGRVRKKIESDPFAECLQIRMNFRSDPSLVHEVNALFHEWMRGPTDERYEPEYAAMEPARPACGTKPRLILLPPPASWDSDCDSGTFVKAEAACLGEFIVELIQSGQTIPKADGSSRPLTYRDIGVLYRTTTHLSELENALKARAIPYQVTGGKDLPRRTEMIALTAVMNAIDNPYDSMNVAGALRSPFFGCSDDDLLAHHLAGGTFDYLATPPEASPLSHAFKLLQELHEARRCLPPSETLARLFDRTAGLFVFALKPQGESRVANLLKVIDLARSLESAGGFSFHSLVQWLNRLEDLRLSEDESPAAESTDDAVQLTTFHKAKGLEFPVVMLYHLSCKHRHHGDQLVHRASQTVEWKSGNLETGGFSALRDEEQDRAFHEAMRLFYVACTRAREMLVIPAYWHSEAKKTETRWFMQMLESRCPRGEDGVPIVQNSGFILHDTNPYDLDTPLQESLVVDIDTAADTAAIEKLTDERNAWQEIRAAASSTLERSSMFARPSAHETDTTWQASAHVQLTAEATRFGRFVHRVLQHIALPGGENMDELAATIGDELSLPADERGQGCELVRSALQSNFFQKRVSRASGLYRELDFTAVLDGKLVEGAMDLVFMENGKPVIVDFKTDRVAAEEAGLRAESYRHQAAAYAAALKSIAGTKPVEVLFYFLRPGTVVSFSATDLASISI
ncbi:hypothetical protein EHM69_11485, partial [candidate division KSB1 bacterium]